MLIEKSRINASENDFSKKKAAFSIYVIKKLL